MALSTENEGLDPVKVLARDFREAVERYHGPRCVVGCTCPMSRALDAVAAFVAAVDGYERGDLVPGGLPSFPR